MQLSITSNTQDIQAKLLALAEIIRMSDMEAMGKALDETQGYAVDFMFSNFMNPQGELEGAFYQVIEDTGDGVEGHLINPSSYAWRREEGFSGMTDSLGRYFPHDPGIAYMFNTLEAETPAIIGIFADSIGQAIGGL